LFDFRIGFAITSSPLIDPKTFLMATGGDPSGSGNVTVYSAKGWKPFIPSMPTGLSFHCMVKLNATTVLVAGGVFPNFTASTVTYIYNDVYKTWFSGPKLNQARQSHKCGKIMVDSTSNKWGVVAIGGMNATSLGTVLSTVEFLDPDLMAWKIIKPVPVPVAGFGLVEDPTGGVFVIGGLKSRGKETFFNKFS
jgi:hypothetical protein